MNKPKQRTKFPHNLKTIRCYYKLSCIEMGEKIKVDGKRLAEVERGRLLPLSSEIFALEKLTKIRAYVLCNYTLQLSITINPKHIKEKISL